MTGKRRVWVRYVPVARLVASGFFALGPLPACGLYWTWWGDHEPKWGEDSGGTLDVPVRILSAMYPSGWA